ncbi:membrane protein of unknown function [Magnetospira sp. QH-2]|nr:membrane protein of unknown function [Magnetospira sp. QH-2]
MKLTLILATVGYFVLASVGQAAVVTYTDRAQFENALGTFTVDSLDGIASSFHGFEARADYDWSGSVYGCINHSGCGSNAGLGFDNSYMWTYMGGHTFNFDTPTMAFGFDYANPSCCNVGALPILEGFTATATAGFFGIISDIALASVNYNQTQAYLIIDNLTYGTAQVPEPASVALLGIGLAGLGFARRRARQSAA